MQMLCIYRSPKEDAAMFVKVSHIIGSKELHRTLPGNALIYFWVPMQVVGQAIGHDISLCYYIYTGRQMLFYFIHQ
jgi:hypothetical protein